jgi:hypothetical protein
MMKLTHFQKNTKQDLMQARIMVATANCIYAGACAPQLFVYTPGMYSSSNRDFVRTTVMDFYEMFRQTVENPGDLGAFAFANDTIDEDRVCPLDDFEWELKVRNEAMKTSCASVQLSSLKQALRMVRIIVDKIVEVLYIEMQIIFCLFRLIIPGSSTDDINQIVQEVKFWFDKLVDHIEAAIKELANILYEMVFNTGDFGQALKEVIMALCKIVEIIVLGWNHFACHVLKIFLAPLLDVILQIMKAIVSLIGQGWEVIDGLQNIVRMIYDLNCEVEVSCVFPESKPQGIEFGALPVATRCWADYTPEIDSTDAFSCTRSDTCRVSDLDYGTALDQETGLLLEDGNQIVCDQVIYLKCVCCSALHTHTHMTRFSPQCPMQPGGIVNSFGCDIYTKQCTCNRPKIERTYCTTNQAGLILFFNVSCMALA